MRDTADLIRRAAQAKHDLLLALKHANAAALDGSQDQADLASLAAAHAQVSGARDALDQLRRRLEFHIELDQLRAGRVGDDQSRYLVSLVRRGVDGGYPVEEVRRMIDAAVGR